ncbi:hypothetical protein KIL84_015752, partial [Mauremys mutica]
VVCVVNNFRGRQPEHENSHMDNLAQMPMISIPRVESPLEKVLRNPDIDNNQEDPLEQNSFKAHLVRFFSWITRMNRFEHLHIRQ